MQKSTRLRWWLTAVLALVVMVPAKLFAQSIDAEAGKRSLIKVVDPAPRQIPAPEAVKRALEVASAGGHNVMMQGPPGSGKTLLARTLPGLLPPLSSPTYTESLAAIKSFFRLADGLQTLFLANADGQLLNIIDVQRWASALPGSASASRSAIARVFRNSRPASGPLPTCAITTPLRKTVTASSLT